MKNETNATGATDSRSVGLPKHHHVKSLPVVLSAFENGRRVVSEGSIAKSYYPDAAEVKESGKDGLSRSHLNTSSLGLSLLRLMGEIHTTQGYITDAQLEAIMGNPSQEVGQ